MSSLPLYFDYAATTPVDERVIRAMVECLGYQACFGNPASNSHAYGRQAR
ncbi:IscS subfamily cysteine desulfurase, partial [Pseudomonas aeruginosa]